MRLRLQRMPISVRRDGFATRASDEFAVMVSSVEASNHSTALRNRTRLTVCCSIKSMAMAGLALTFTVAVAAAGGLVLSRLPTVPRSECRAKTVTSSFSRLVFQLQPGIAHTYPSAFLQRTAVYMNLVHRMRQASVCSRQ
jgi:hypothetical protein